MSVPYDDFRCAVCWLKMDKHGGQYACPHCGLVVDTDEDDGPNDPAELTDHARMEGATPPLTLEDV